MAQAVSKSLEDYFRLAKEMETPFGFCRRGENLCRGRGELSPTTRTLKRLGLIYQTQMKFQESIDTFHKVLQQAPQYPEVNFYLGFPTLGSISSKKL